MCCARPHDSLLRIFPLFQKLEWCHATVVEKKPKAVKAIIVAARLSMPINIWQRTIS